MLDAPDPAFDPTQAHLWAMYWDLRHEAGENGVKLPDDPVLAHHMREMDRAYMEELSKAREAEREMQVAKAKSGGR